MSFSSLLKIEDRQKLRAIIYKVHFKHYPDVMLTPYEADKLIDSFSERVIEANLKAAEKIL